MYTELEVMTVLKLVASRADKLGVDESNINEVRSVKNNWLSI